jgi:hypothetical protein
MKGPEGEFRYCSTLFLTLALCGDRWSKPHPHHFIPWKETQCPLNRGLGGTQGQSGQAKKILPLPGFYPQTAKPTLSPYTNYIIPVHNV